MKSYFFESPSFPVTQYITQYIDCFSPFLLSLPHLASILNWGARHSQELFKQNANGPLMEPYFSIASPSSWQTIESAEEFTLRKETKGAQPEDIDPKPPYKSHQIYSEWTGAA